VVGRKRAHFTKPAAGNVATSEILGNTLYYITGTGEAGYLYIY